MRAIHDQFTHQTCDRLKTTCMGLGLVRLLQDAKRFEEARTTLYSLETGFQGAESAKPSQEHSNASQLKRISRSRSSASTRTEVAEIPTEALSIA
jgi:hypothetical protein